MKKVNKHEDLTVWQKSHQLTLDVFRTVNDVDPILFEFMKESALRVVSKIAEGISKVDSEEQIADLQDAKGATARLSTQVLLSAELDYIKKDYADQLYAQSMEVAKMLSGLIKYLANPKK
jgi:four helix bundle protein